MRGAWLVAGALALIACMGAPARAQRGVAVDSPEVPINPSDTAGLRKVGAEVLFWSQAQRDANFPHMEKIFPGHIVKAGKRTRRLPPGKPLPIADADVDAFIAAQNVAGLIVLQDGKVRLERYARGYGPDGRYTSFSVAKSFTSTLVGAAIRDGFIGSVDEPVTKYIPELAGSGYDGGEHRAAADDDLGRQVERGLYRRPVPTSRGCSSSRCRRGRTPRSIT